MAMTVPVNILTGFLGVGKTTAILNAFRFRPADERWAVLVNEFGEVGIDGATLEASGGYIVKEIAGGCICCTAGPLLRVAMARLLREERPDRLFIEPTGLAHPAAIVDMLRSPGIKMAVSPRALIGLVNPSHFVQARYRKHETYDDQLHMADLLIANHWDTSSEDDRATFLEQARAWFPPKLGVYTTSMGQMAREWLDVEPRIRDIQETLNPHVSPDVSTKGWVFPTEYVFDRMDLMDFLQQLVRPQMILNCDVLRIKGVFRTKRVWLLLNGGPETLTVKAINYRRDSRFEVIVDGPEPDWSLVENALLETVCAGR